PCRVRPRPVAGRAARHAVRLRAARRRRYLVPDPHGHHLLRRRRPADQGGTGRDGTGWAEGQRLDPGHRQLHHAAGPGSGQPGGDPVSRRGLVDADPHARPTVRVMTGAWRTVRAWFTVAGALAAMGLLLTLPAPAQPAPAAPRAAG